MGTVQVPYVPPAGPSTTTVAETITTTTIVCTVTSHDMPNLGARLGQTINIPSVGYTSPVGGKAQFVNLTIVAVPLAADGVLKLNGSTLANGATITAANLGKLQFEAHASTFDGGTFTYKVVTSCGESATYTATIALLPPLTTTCDCP